MLTTGSCRPDDVDILRTRSSHCSADVAQWCASRRLQLNADKTEVIWFDSRTNIKKLRDYELSVRCGPEKIIPVRAARDLGVQLDDEELSVKAHVTKVSSVCYYQLRRLRQIRRRKSHNRAYSWCLITNCYIRFTFTFNFCYVKARLL